MAKATTSSANGCPHTLSGYCIHPDCAADYCDSYGNQLRDGRPLCSCKANVGPPTPGPWRATKAACEEIYGLEEHDAVIAAEAGPMIADVCPCPESVANARLIAAAPDLLEYCEGLLEDAEQLLEDPTVAQNWDWQLTVDNLKHLIGKAEGVAFGSFPPPSHD